MAKLTGKRREKSTINRDEFYLSGHDEEKVLMFATGLVLGIGLTSFMLGIFVFGGLVLVTIALALIYMEQRQKMRDRKELL